MSADMRVPAIDVIVEASSWSADAEATARRALAEAAAATGADFRSHVVALLLTDDAAVRRLNAQWRGIDAMLRRAVAEAAALASEASGQRGNSKVRAPDTRQDGSSAHAAMASTTDGERRRSWRSAHSLLSRGRALSAARS